MDVAKARLALEQVKDPEVPVLSIIELGIVREVEVTGDRVEITVTPTYSGCPAMTVIERDIHAALAAEGFAEIIVRTTFAPPWTTDWMSAVAKEKLRAYGIAPPLPRGAEPLIPMPRTRATITCPFCGGTQTESRSEFGSTACKALMFCYRCSQPFEYFKSF